MLVKKHRVTMVYTNGECEYIEVLEEDMALLRASVKKSNTTSVSYKNGEVEVVIMTPHIRKFIFPEVSNE